MTKALFLDRDGVINIDKLYVYKIEDFEFVSGIFEVLSLAQAKAYLLIIVTNQSGIARNYYSKADFEKLTNFMLDEFKKHNIKINKVYHCPHHPDDNCSCRKPKTQMLQQAQTQFNIDFSQSFMIGDRRSDILCANNAGVKSIFFNPQESCLEADITIQKLSDLIQYL